MIKNPPLKGTGIFEVKDLCSKSFLSTKKLYFNKKLFKDNKKIIDTLRISKDTIKAFSSL